MRHERQQIRHEIGVLRHEISIVLSKINSGIVLSKINPAYMVRFVPECAGLETAQHAARIQTATA